MNCSAVKVGDLSRVMVDFYLLTRVNDSHKHRHLHDSMGFTCAEDASETNYKYVSERKVEKKGKKCGLAATKDVLYLFERRLVVSL